MSERCFESRMIFRKRFWRIWMYIERFYENEKNRILSNFTSFLKPHRRLGPEISSRVIYLCFIYSYYSMKNNLGMLLQNFYVAHIWPVHKKGRAPITMIIVLSKILPPNEISGVGIWLSSLRAVLSEVYWSIGGAQVSTFFVTSDIPISVAFQDTIAIK